MEVLKQMRIADEDKARLLQLRIDLFNETMDELAHSLRIGRITLGFFEEELRTQIRLLHAGAMAIGKGSWQAVTQSDWGKVGAELRGQYVFLHRFAQDVLARRATISEAAIAWRAKLYGLKAAHTATLGQAGDITALLPWIPRDGTTICLNGCMCGWELLEVRRDALSGTKNIQATWRLSPVESCETCLGRDGYTLVMIVPEDMDIPAFIGLGG